MRRSLARYSRSDACRTPWLAGCITNTSGFRFSARTGDEGTFEVDGRQFVPGRKRNDQIAVNCRQRAPRHDQTAIRGASEGCNGAAACKLRFELGGFPDICEPTPSKPKWTRRRTYQCIRNKIQALEAKAKTRRFKKPLSSQLFAYHIG
jgi:hypothetical protein